MYLLIHTMTIADNDFVLQAHFFHAFSDNLTRAGNGRLIGRRFSLRIHPSLRRNRNKLSLQRLQAPNLRTLMKRNSAVIKHNLRTVHMYVSFIIFILFFLRLHHFGQLIALVRPFMHFVNIPRSPLQIELVQTNRNTLPICYFAPI